MDEIEWKKYVKKVILTFAKIFIFTGIVLFVFCLFVWSEITGLINILTDLAAIKLIVSVCVGFIVIFIIFEAIITISMYIIYKIKYAPRKQIILEKEYLRGIPNKYSPAVSSLVYDLKIDIYKDYTSTILYLCTQKYINIKRVEGKYEFEILNKDSSNLSKSENYVFNKIINKTKFDEEKFKNLIIEEAMENSLIVNNTKNKKVTMLLAVSVISILIIALYNININLLLILLTTIPFLALMVQVLKNPLGFEDEINTNDLKSIKEKYKRSHNGKKLARELQAFKNHIKEYTLIKEKNVDYIQILEDYIPYAISLGEADTIEEFIKHNEEYRSLIYDRKIDE